MLNSKRLEEIKKDGGNYSYAGWITSLEVLELVTVIEKMRRYISNMCEFGCGQPGEEDFKCRHCSVLAELFEPEGERERSELTEDVSPTDEG